MAEKQKSGLLSKYLEGKQRESEYQRETLTTSRWSQFFGLLKGKFWKICVVNIMMVLFALPAGYLFFMRYLNLLNLGASNAFGANIGAGYPAYLSFAGVEQGLIWSNNSYYNGLLIISFLVLAIGVSGGFYVLRNMVWTDGNLVFADFWKGIKLNAINVILDVIFGSVIFFLSFYLIDFCAYQKALGVSAFWMTVCQIVGYIVFFFGLMMTFWMMSMSNNYSLKYFVRMRNAFFFTLGFFFQTAFFMAIMIAPFYLLIQNSTLFVTGLLLLAFFGIAFSLLIWAVFTQHVYDKYFGAAKAANAAGRTIKDKKASESAAVQQYNATVARQKVELASRPVKPIIDELLPYELPASFTRGDIKKVEEGRAAIVADNEAYVAEHKDDAKFVEYNKQFEKAPETASKAKKQGKKAKQPTEGDFITGKKDVK